MRKGYAKLVVFLLAIATVVVNGIAAAALSGRKDADIEFISGETLTISLSSDDVAIENLIPGTADDSNEITVSVATNSELGYTLTASVGTTENNTNSLIHTDSNQTDLFTSIAVGVSVNAITEDRTWGFSTDHGATYSGMPTFFDDEHIETINTTDEPSLDDIPFLIGARANKFQAPGEYRNIVTFTATANPIPDTIATIRYMQDINDDVYASMEVEQQYQLIDKRDNKKYWIAKLADGNVWMTQNLNLELTTPGITMYPNTSNVNEVTVLPVAEFEPKSYIDNYRTDVSYISYIDPNQYIENGTFIDENGKRVEETHLASTQDLEASDENWHYVIGDRIYYTSDISATLNGLCPKNWILPSYFNENVSNEANSQYELRYLFDNYPTVGSSPAYIIPTNAENIQNGAAGESAIKVSYLVNNNNLADGNYRRSSKMVTFSINSENKALSNDGYYDYYDSVADYTSVRCVALRSHLYQFTYYYNDKDDSRVVYTYVAGSWGGADASIKALDNRIGDYEIMPPLGYTEFLGWATTPDATTPEYQPGDTIITNMNSANNFYAVWGSPVEVSLEDAFAAAGKTKVDGEHYAMQDMDIDICSAASVNSGIDLIDTRDGNIYKVAKYKRESVGSSATCWMVDSLRLGSTETSYTLTPDDSDVKNEFTLPAKSTWGQSTNTAEFYADDSQDENGIYYGNRYNTYAMSAGTNNRNSSICPKGWRIPTLIGARSYYELLVTYSGNFNSSSGINTKDIVATFDFSFTGASDGSNFNDHTVGYYWGVWQDGNLGLLTTSYDASATQSGSSASRNPGYSVGTSNTNYYSDTFAAIRCIMRTEH